MLICTATKNVDPLLSIHINSAAIYHMSDAYILIEFSTRRCPSCPCFQHIKSCSVVFFCFALLVRLIVINIRYTTAFFYVHTFINETLDSIYIRFGCLSISSVIIQSENKTMIFVPCYELFKNGKRFQINYLSCADGLMNII